MESSPATQIISGEVYCNLSHIYNILHGPTVLTNISSKWNKLLQSCVGTPGHIIILILQ